MSAPPDPQSPKAHTQKEPSDPQPKKPWTDPKLVRYGDIQQITQSVGMIGALDSAMTMGAMSKTR